jgi:hypothetical protein
VTEERNGDGEWVKRGSAPALHVLTSLHARLTGPACYFVRLNAKSITDKTIADDVNFGVIKGNCLNTLKSLVNDLYNPVLCKQEKWGRLAADLHAELLKRVCQFGSTLAEAGESLAGGVELTKPDGKYMSIPMTLSGFRDAAEKPDVAKDFTRYLKSWIDKVRARIRLLSTHSPVHTVNVTACDMQCAARMSSCNV